MHPACGQNRSSRVHLFCSGFRGCSRRHEPWCRKQGSPKTKAPPALLPREWKRKTPLTEEFSSVKDEKNLAFYPRCHPDFMGMTPCTWRDANTSPATDVCPTLQNTVRRKFSAVPCTLSGPFRENITQSHTFLDELFPVCFSAAQALCTGMVRRYLRFNGLVY